MSDKGLVLVHPYDSENKLITVPAGWTTSTYEGRMWLDHYDSYNEKTQSAVDKTRVVQTKWVMNTSGEQMVISDKAVLLACGVQEVLAALIAVPNCSWYTIQQIRDGVDATAIDIRDNWLDERNPPGEGEIVQLYGTPAGYDYITAIESTVPGDFSE